METLEEKQKKVEDILASHGIQMSVDGCGCCGSPHVQFKYEGVMILDDEHVAIDNFTEDHES